MTNLQRSKINVIERDHIKACGKLVNKLSTEQTRTPILISCWPRGDDGETSGKENETKVCKTLMFTAFKKLITPRIFQQQKNLENFDFYFFSISKLSNFTKGKTNKNNMINDKLINSL